MIATPHPLARCRTLYSGTAYTLDPPYRLIKSRSYLPTSVTTVWVFIGAHGWEIWADFYGEPDIMIADEIDARSEAEALATIGYEVRT